MFLTKKEIDKYISAHMEGESGLKAVENDIKTRLKASFNKILFFQTIFTCGSIAFFVFVYYIWRGKQREAEKNDSRVPITPIDENLTDEELIKKYGLVIKPKKENFTTEDAWPGISYNFKLYKELFYARKF